MLLAQQRVLGVKIEDTAGTEATLESGDYDFLFYEANLAPQPEIIQRQPHMKYDGNMAAVVGGRPGQLTLRTELYSVSGGVPIWTRLLNICKFVSATGGWHPVTSLASQKTATIYYNQSGVLKKMIGCAGTARIILTAGQIAVIEWTITGIAVTPWTDVSMPDPDYETYTPLIVSSSTFTLNSVTPIVNEVSIDLGNTVAMRRAITGANGGMLHAYVGTRNPTMNLDPESVLMATRNNWGHLVDSDELAFSCQLSGGTGNIVTITAPKVQITGIAEAERDTLAVDNLTCQLNRDEGDDWLNIAFS